MTSNLKWVESWKPINSTTGVAYVSKCHSTLTTVEWMSKLIRTRTYTHLLLLTLWHWKHRNQEYYYRKWGDNDKYLLLLFKTFLYIQRLLVIMFVSYAVSLSLSASFISFTFLMGCALMKYWLEASRRLSQLLLKIDNDQLLLLSSDRCMFK